MAGGNENHPRFSFSTRCAVERAQQLAGEAFGARHRRILPLWGSAMTSPEAVGRVIEQAGLALDALDVPHEYTKNVTVEDLAHFYQVLFRDESEHPPTFQAPFSIPIAEETLVRRFAGVLAAQYRNGIRFRRFYASGAPSGFDQFPVYTRFEKAKVFENAPDRIPFTPWAKKGYADYMAFQAKLGVRNQNPRSKACQGNDADDPLILIPDPLAPKGVVPLGWDFNH